MKRNKNTRPGAATPKRVEDTRVHNSAATSSTNQFITEASEGQRSIAELLAVGAENGLTSRQLSQLTGLDTRTIQARISAERLSGVPICSDTLNGFYMPSNDEEKARCIRSLRRRGIEILRVAEAMNRIPGDGQMELHIGEMDDR
jgi:uncharacterized protein with von Willebrand factor type A (vWA) domain